MFGLLIAVLLINIPTVTSSHIDYTNDANIDIDIIDVTDGIGLDIIIKNNGDTDVEDILLEINTEDKTIIVPKKQYKIQFLSEGNSTNIHIYLFGFNIGIIRNYSKINFMITIDDIKFSEGEITFGIMGLIISIKGYYFHDDKPNDGYILYSPMWSTTTYLINNASDIVHSWENSIYQDSQTTYLLENGNLVRTAIAAGSSFITGGFQGRIEIFDWNDTRIWNYKYSTKDYRSHHDIQPLPNGNFLIIAWETFTKTEAINAGRNPLLISGDSFWADHIIEVEPVGDSEGIIVWEWHVWDHLIQDQYQSKDNYGVISDHPELIDINYIGGLKNDFNHINSVDYNSEYDQILLSVKHFNEIWVIDHSTTTEESAGHSGGRYGKGGDLLYRWGNPLAYKHGSENDQKFFGQHGANWVKSGYPGEGNILVFNSGTGGPEGKYSSVDEIIPPIDENGFYRYIKNQAYKPKEQLWTFGNNNSKVLFSNIASNVLRLPNGNTLICSASQGLFLEVTYNLEIVWEYLNPYPIGLARKTVARIQWYSSNYPGLINIF